MSELACGKCGLPIHPSEIGLRHYGTFTAHSEWRCVDLLKKSAADALAAQAKEIEALRKDAERYRWLCDDLCDEQAEVRNRLVTRMFVMGKGAIDAAIDAALTPKKRTRGF